MQDLGILQRGPDDKLFRNDSPEALTREQAVALEKKRMKERARQARELAAWIS
jgi:hypothetical protein